MRIEASAPGKLLLLGEYAVLEGAPALVMAVDRRVCVDLVRQADGPATLTAEQLGVHRAVLSWTASGLECGAAAARLGMTAALLPRLTRELRLDAERLAHCSIGIDSSALFSSASPQAAPVKLGLGSSAAVAAALIATFEALAGEGFEGDGEVSPRDRLQRWLPIYREALGADASGADLAASLAGGLHWYRPPSEGAAAILQPALWPADLSWRALWVGAPAQTVDFVGALRAWQQRDPLAAGKRLEQMRSVVSALVGRQDAVAWLEALDAYAEQLEPLGQGIGREVLSAPHRRLRTLARDCDVVYKSAGAGGGDLGIAVALHPDALERFVAAARSEGAVPVELTMDSRGAVAQSDGSRARGAEPAGLDD